MKVVFTKDTFHIVKKTIFQKIYVKVVFTKNNFQVIIERFIKKKKT